MEALKTICGTHILHCKYRQMIGDGRVLIGRRDVEELLKELFIADNMRMLLLLVLSQALFSIEVKMLHGRAI